MDEAGDKALGAFIPKGVGGRVASPRDEFGHHRCVVDVVIEIARLKPDATRVSIGMNEEEMLAALREVEQILEYAEVVRMADDEFGPQR